MSVQKIDLPHTAVWSEVHCLLLTVPMKIKEKNVQSFQEKPGDVCK